jgi:hypothetical protein
VNSASSLHPLLATARKSFKKIQEIVKKVYIDKKRLDENADVSNYQKKRRRGNWWRRTRGISKQWLPSPISSLK